MSLIIFLFLILVYLLWRYSLLLTSSSPPAAAAATALIDNLFSVRDLKKNEFKILLLSADISFQVEKNNQSSLRW